MGIASVVDTLNNSVAFINCFRPTEPTLEIKCAVEIEKQNLIASIGPIVNRPAAIAIEKKLCRFAKSKILHRYFTCNWSTWIKDRSKLSATCIFWRGGPTKMSAGAGQHKARADADQLTKSGRAQRKHTAQAQSTFDCSDSRAKSTDTQPDIHHTPHTFNCSETCRYKTNEFYFRNYILLYNNWYWFGIVCCWNWLIKDRMHFKYLYFIVFFSFILSNANAK